MKADYCKFMKAAIEEAAKGLREGGIPIGSVLVKGNKIIAKGYNRRVQKKSAILHAEMDCLNSAGRLSQRLPGMRHIFHFIPLRYVRRSDTSL